ELVPDGRKRSFHMAGFRRKHARSEVDAGTHRWRGRRPGHLVRHDASLRRHHVGWLGAREGTVRPYYGNRPRRMGERARITCGALREAAESLAGTAARA